MNDNDENSNLLLTAKVIKLILGDLISTAQVIKLVLGDLILKLKL